MNKQELIGKLKKEQQSIKWGISDGYNAFYNGIDTAYSIAIGLAKQLDEPKKVVVPKFVAYFIEDGNNYDKIAFLAHQKYLGINSLMRECPVKDWLMSVDYETVLSLVNGYEVEKEQLYYVKLPDLRSSQSGNVYGLKKIVNGEIRVGVFDKQEIGKTKDSQLTEQEIKAIDERYWPFAVKVDGE